jgi:MinD-like ATPase involved in chromosome partitioning or flagellar assembly
VIVVVTGGKGAPGATVLALSIGRAFARSGRSTLLMDIDPCGGDMGAYLAPDDLDPRRGLLPLLQLERGAVAPEVLARETQTVGPNLWLLLGMMRPAAGLLDGRVDDLLRAGTRLAEAVVVDIGRAVSGSPSTNALKHADRTLLAARPDLQGALAAERAISVMGQGHDFTVVATGARQRRRADVVELAEALNREIAFSILDVPSPAAGLPRGRRFDRSIDRLVGTLRLEEAGARSAIEVIPLQGAGVS